MTYCQKLVEMLITFVAQEGKFELGPSVAAGGAAMDAIAFSGIALVEYPTVRQGPRSELGLGQRGRGSPNHGISGGRAGMMVVVAMQLICLRLYLVVMEVVVAAMEAVKVSSPYS
jgi:hypothetical protein